MGPLSGFRIVEFAGIGPVPFCGMMLADAGAEVIRVERPGKVAMRDPTKDILSRGRKSVQLDLKRPEGIEAARDLARTVDGLIEGFRPGVMERLGLGPKALTADNRRLVYGRMTGWGQDGPLSQTAGHDINYIAMAGALHSFGRAGGKPTPPANLVGDFGGGGMMLAFGMAAGLAAAARGEGGRVVDCAMVDGVSAQMALIWSLRAEGRWRDERGVNLLDTGAPFYDVYETADGRHLAVGALEPAFYRALVQTLGVADEPDFARQMDEAAWPRMRERLTELFRTRTREAWTQMFASVEACVTPVLSPGEALHHPHNVARAAFVEVGGVVQPAPAPRFSTAVKA